MKNVLLAAAFAIVAIPGAGEARVWTVGRGSTDFPLIAPAIAHAEDGDEIRIGAGVYREDLVIAKRLSLVGEGRPVLFGTGRGTVIDVRADNCVIQNLIIDGTGVGAGNQMDAAVRLTSSGNVVSGNVMRRVFYGVVIAGGADNLVTDNQIEGLLDLPFGRRGDGVYVYQGPRTHIMRNRIVGQRDAIFLQYAHDGRVEGNVVFTYLDAFDEDDIAVEDLKARYIRGGLGDSIAKKRLDDVLQALLAPIRERRRALARDPGYVLQVVKRGTARARETTDATLRDVRTALGLFILD